MSLYSQLLHRQETDNPIKIGMVGAGKFASMFLSQARALAGVQIVGIVDLNPAAARSNLEYVGWPADGLDATSLDEAVRTGKIYIFEDVDALAASPHIDIMVEATGDPIAAIDHIVTSFAYHKHVINVTVEADAYCGAGLASVRARQVFFIRLLMVTSLRSLQSLLTGHVVADFLSWRLAEAISGNPISGFQRLRLSGITGG